MSAPARYDRPGLLERLTSSTAFAVLFGIAATILAPTLLLGVLVSAMALIFGFHETDDLALLLVTFGGVVGVIGLARARRAPTSRFDYRLTLAALASGLVTAAAIVGALAARTGLEDKLTMAAIALMVPPFLAGLGRISRLRRLRAAAEGRVRDSLPLIFLAVALLELACAGAIGLQLAIVG
jgi:hypothetical protein